MNLTELKKRIFEEEKIEELLEYLDCQNIHQEQNGNLIVAKLPEKFGSDNARSVQVKNNEYLNSKVYSRGIDGDLFLLIGYLEYNCSNFDEAKEKLWDITCYICNALEFNLEELHSEKKKKDWNWFLRDVQKERKIELYLENIPENKPDNVKNRFIPELHIKWFNEGISYESRDIFNLGYDIRYDRITIPVENSEGEVIGIKGRSIEDLDEYKYISYYPFYKSIELFNYHRAYEEIQNKKQVIIVESEKSAIKIYQWGFHNVVALMGSDLSPAQAQLIKKLGLDIEIIFMFDKDKDLVYIKSQVKQLKTREKNIKIMIDKGLLKEKDSPTDYGRKVFKRLLEDYTFPLRELKNG